MHGRILTSFSRSVSGRMAAHLPGAQTERRGDAGPAGGLLGGKAPPAAFHDCRINGLPLVRGR